MSATKQDDVPKQDAPPSIHKIRVVRKKQFIFRL